MRRSTSRRHASMVSRSASGGTTTASGTTQAAGLKGRGTQNRSQLLARHGFLNAMPAPDDRQAGPAGEIGDPLVDRAPGPAGTVGRHAEMASIDPQASFRAGPATPPRVVEPRTTLNPSRLTTCVISSPSRCSLIRMCISGQFQ